MQKWPDVPRVYGWLRLDRRGHWLVKSREGVFERIGNGSVNDFIGRNYAADHGGCWYFQNGPQRVFVTLDYTPFVFRLADEARIVAHTGEAAGEIHGLLLDERGTMLASTLHGVGVIEDRDLPMLIDRLAEENPEIDGGEALPEFAERPGTSLLRLFGKGIWFAGTQSTEVPARFGYVMNPRPPEGEPDC
jgi:hypothetical protein